MAHARELRERAVRDLAQTRAELSSIAADVERDGQVLTEIERGMAGFEPGLAAGRELEAAALARLQASETALDAWQEQWHSFNLDVKEQQQTRQVEQTRLEHLEAHQARLDRQLQSVESERQSISVVDLEARLVAQDRLQADTQRLLTAEVQALELAGFTLSSQREAEQRLGGDIEQLRGELEARRGRLDAMRVIQNSALGNEEEILGGWLNQSGLTDRDRLVQQLSAESRWIRAVETVLGDFLQAVCVDDAGRLARSLPEATVVLLESGGEQREVPPDSLANKVQNAGNVREQLAGVLCVESVDEALQRQGGLTGGQSVITPDGVWVGPGWVRVNRGQRYVGMLAREREIRELEAAVIVDEAKIAAMSQGRLTLRETIDGLERERQSIQLRLTETNRQSLESASAAATLHQDLERARQRLEVLVHDGESVSSELAELHAVINEARQRLQLAESRLAELDLQRPGFREQQDALLADYNAARAAADVQRVAVGQILIEFESRRAAQGAAAAALERVTQQQNQLIERSTVLEAHIRESEAPLLGLQSELDAQLARQVDVQADLARQRDRLTEVEQRVKVGESQRHELEKRVAAEREAVEQLRMQVRELEVRGESLAERFAATSLVLAEVQAQTPVDANPELWDQRLAQTRSSIERLGPINLAAIDEFSEQSERKTYLDSQHADLTSALETLEQAIRRIDRESRTRFQETFDSINSGLKKLFPRLFGGGHAYLTLEGDDLRSAGVTVMARPPGKRNSHIHLLSGGEKALTAVALIFSIFELNPAPFCLLDEVDAPLDEANVARFCDIVREMSKSVQFIVITHNKTTMEMTKQLTGVTMNEPGVSRLVAVDIDEAVKLVAS